MKRSCTSSLLLASVLAAGLGPMSSAQAFDSCKVLICLAGAWRSIPTCHPDVPDFLHCFVRGKCSLNCALSNGSTLQWANSGNCPPQYTVETDNGVTCAKSGVINIPFNGVTNWVRVWWTMGGAEEPVFEYSAPAKAFLGEHADPRFDDELARWLAAQPLKDQYDNGGH